MGKNNILNTILNMEVSVDTAVFIDWFIMYLLYKLQILGPEDCMYAVGQVSVQRCTTIRELKLN